MRTIKRCTAFIISAAMALSALPVIPAMAADNTPPSAPTGLLTNELENPLNVEEPTFGWIVNDTDENEVQTAYEIVVTDEITNIAVWDSGKVTSSEQSYVPCGGTLDAGHPYSWKVKTWDKDGAESPYSDSAYFATGLTENSDWGAVWISDGTEGAKATEGSYNHFWYARKSDTLDSSKTVAKAYAYISGLQDYDLYVNNIEIGRGQSFDYASESRYQGWDITDAVKSVTGSVTVGALIRTYGGGQGRAPVNAGLLGRINIFYTDGTVKTIVTDKTWKVSGSVPFSGTTVRNGEGDFVENYNAQNAQENFTSASFNDSSWKTASDRVVDETISKVTPELSKPTAEEIEPVSITVLSNGTTVADFGKVIPARPEIVFKNGKAGSKYTIQAGYMLNSDGSVNSSGNATQTTNMTWVYTQKAGEQTYNAWDHLGFRYLSIPSCGETFTKDTLKAKIVHTNVPEGRGSTFVSSNEMLNNVYELMKRSAIYGVQNEFVDTPTREKGQFTDDARNISEATMATQFEREASRKAIMQFIGSADRYWTGSQAGRYNSVYPNVDGKRDIPEYSVNFPQWVWNYYLNTGDKATLEYAYPYIKATAANYIAGNIKSSGLVEKLEGGSSSYEFGIVDWPSSGRFGYDWNGTKDGARTTINMLSKHAFDVVALAAEELGKTDDAADMRKRSENLKNAINSKLLNSKGLYSDGTGSAGNLSSHVSQHANSYALAFDIVPDANKEQVAEYVASLGMRQGPMTADILAKGLFKAGKNAAALKLFTEPRDYGWAREVANGFTFTWESWMADGVSVNDSQSHSWGSTAASDILRNFAGVQILEAGAKKIKIAPVYTDLESLNASVSTERGAVGVKYERTDSKFEMTVTIPANVKADIELPNVGNGNYTQDGKTLSSKSLTDIGSGIHTFTYEGAITEPEKPVYKPELHTGIKGYADTDSSTYIWEMGEGSSNNTYTDTENDYVGMTVSLGSGDSMDENIVFSGASVREPDTAGQASLNDTRRYLIVEPKYDGTFNINVTFSSTAGAGRVMCIDLGTNVDKSAINLSQYQKNNDAAFLEVAKNASSPSKSGSKTMTAGHTYLIYTYNYGSTITEMSYKYIGGPDPEPTTAPASTPTATPIAKPDVKYMHISFDDVYVCLKDITDNSYTSVFENSFLKDLKELHDTYGAVFTLNCFNKYTKDSSYDISKLPDRYAAELAANSGWLKFAFHAQNDKTQYTTASVSGRTNRGAAQAAGDYNVFLAAVMKATGNNTDSIDTVTRLGFFAGDSDVIDALKAADHGITGLLTADDTRVSYYFNTDLNNYIIQNEYYYDTVKALDLIRSQLRLESVSNTTQTLAGLADKKMLEIFTHEQEYKGNVPNRLKAYVEWAKDNGYEFGFAMDLLDNSKPSVTNAPTDKPDTIQVTEKNAFDDKLDYTVKVNGISDGVLITAVYDEDGTLYWAHSDVLTGNDIRVSVPLQGGKSDIKFMVWDGLDTMKPLAEAVTDKYESAKPAPTKAPEATIKPSEPTETVIPYEPDNEESSSIHLDRVVYPLVVGNSSKTNFSTWQDQGSEITISAKLDAGKSVSNLSWEIEDEDIAYITSSRNYNTSSIRLKGKRTGFTKLTASLPDGDKAVCYLSVIDNVTRSTVQTLEFNTDNLLLMPTMQATLIPIINPKDVFGNGALDTSLTWSTSNASVATVSGGVVTAVANGTATITATSNDIGRTAVCTVNVGDVSSLDQAKAADGIIDMTVGDKEPIDAGSGSFTWRSDDPSAVDVDSNGVVTAYASTKVEKLVNNENYVSGNTSEPLKASEKRIDFENGKVVYEKGTVKVYATAPNGTVTTYLVSISDAPVTVHDVAISEEKAAVEVGETKTLKAAILPASAMDKRVTWKSSDPSVASVSENALTIEELNSTTVTGVSRGTATITAECDGITAECVVTVGGTEPGAVEIVNASSAALIDVDEIVELEASTDVTGGDPEMLWVSSDADTVTVSNDGIVQGLKTGEATVYAIAADTLDDNGRAAVEALRYARKATPQDISKLRAVSESCTVEVKESSPYLRNLHIPAETITDNSVNLLWNSASKMDIPDLDSYNVYVNGTLTANTKMLGYTVEGLEPDTAYEFKVEAVTANDEIHELTVDARTKEQSVWLNVLDYGAKGNGRNLDTYAIQKVIDACPENGTVYLPKGYVFYSGALFLKSNMTFKVDGILMGSPYSKDYPFMVTRWEGWRKVNQKGSEWANTTTSLPDNHYAHASLINAGTYDEGEIGYAGHYNVENIVIRGTGQINGNGFKLGYNEGLNQKTGDGGIPVPMTPALDQTIRGRLITVHNADGLYMKDVQAAYGPSWTIHPIYSKNMTFDNIDVIARGSGRTGAADDICILNGDGLDPDSSIKVNIFNTFFYAGDDAIAIKTGRNREGNELGKPTQFIRVTDSESNTSKGGFAVGSENASGVRNLLFQNLKIVNPKLSHGVWFKTYWSRGGLSEDIIVRDIDSSKPLNFSMAYSTAENNPAVKVPEYRYITVENVNNSIQFEGIKAEKGHSASYVNQVTVRGADKGGSISYGKDFTIWDSSESKWSQSNASSIVFAYSDSDTNTRIKIKDGAEHISSVDNEALIIIAVTGATADDVLGEIESAIPDASLTYEVNGSILTVTAQDGVTTADYTISYATVWDFSKYTTEVKTTESGFTESYDGLTIAIANNGGDSDHDKITTGGVYWRGGASSGNSPRYIAYTPETDGVLTVTGKVNANQGRFGISDSLVVTSLKADSSSSTSQTETTITKECTAGTTYYIMPKDRSATVSKVAYAPK